MRHLLIGLFALACTAPAMAEQASAPPEPVRVMVIGTWHFGSPGQDVNNMESLDVLAARRQAELAQLTDALAKFAPTKVAVERQGEAPGYVDTTYAGFTRSKLSDVRDERTQIGYRLAARMGHDTVYAIDEQPAGDEPDYFPYEPLVALDNASGEPRLPLLNSQVQEQMARFKAIEDDLSIAALLELLAKGFFPPDYYDEVLLIGRGEDQPGPELAAYWYMRNAKIFNKLAQVAEPGDRVVVVYGDGHSDWLRRIVQRVDGYELVDAVPYLRKASGPPQ